MGRLSVKCYEGEAFQNMYRKGCFNGIDFLASNFKGYRLMFQYEAKVIFVKNLFILMMH